MIKLKKNYLEKYINKIVIFSIFCVLVVYIIILVYQLNFINNIYNIFIAFYYNYIQRDKLVNLHSSISSASFFFAGMTNYGPFADFSIFMNFIKKRAGEFNNAHHTFYQKYIDYRFALGKDLSPFYVRYNFSKVHVVWKEFIIEDNYVEESEVMTYHAMTCTLNDTLDNIAYDLKVFFNSNYTNYPKEDLKSIFTQLLFYFCKNMQNTFIQFFFRFKKKYIMLKIIIQKKLRLQVL